MLIKYFPKRPKDLKGYKTFYKETFKEENVSSLSAFIHEDTLWIFRRMSWNSAQNSWLKIENFKQTNARQVLDDYFDKRDTSFEGYLLNLYKHLDLPLGYVQNILKEI